MSSHVVPTRTYYGIFGLLMLCTYLTVQAAFIDLGPLNVVLALGIAAFKAAIVILYFMHVKYSPKLTQLVVLSAVLWLVILLALTFSDYLTRGWLTFG